MKKTSAIVLSVIVLMSVMLNAFAANVSNKVYADAVTVEGGEQVTIPVKIENNNGFMGFSIIVSYDSEKFTPVSVSKSSILSGMFNDSIATSTNNSFKVVYSGTSNVTDSGELFNIAFDVADNTSGKYEIELSYSQQDTFNENWDDVVLACENIEVIVTENGTTAPTTVTTTQSTTVTTTESTTQNQGTTIKPTTTQPVTEPSTEPGDEPDAGKPLSVRMREWVNGLPFPLNIILGIFVIPVSYIVAIFE